MPIYSCMQTHCIYTLYAAYCIVVLYKIQENTIQVQTCIKDLQERVENKAMCVRSHMLFCASLSGQEWEVVSISGSAHLQGRQWVDMIGRIEGSEDKGEVCVRCEGVGGVGWES